MAKKQSSKRKSKGKKTEIKEQISKKVREDKVRVSGNPKGKSNIKTFES